MMLFEESIKSKYTKKNYHFHLRKFRTFAKISNEDILAATNNGLQKMLEDYLIHLKRTANPNSIPYMFQGIRHFCIMNHIHPNWEIIYRMFPQQRKCADLRSYTTDEVHNILHHTKGLRNRALVHFLASTGARIGVFDHPLTVGHLKKMPETCTAVKVYAGEIEEYWTFLTPQASNALYMYHQYRKKVGEHFCNTTPIFTVRNSTSRQLGWNGARSTVYRIISKCMTRNMQDNGRYDVQVDHGFRKRFNTILKLDNSVNYNVAEKLMGHKNGLDGTYLTPTLSELFAEFRKIIRKIEV